MQNTRHKRTNTEGGINSQEQGIQQNTLNKWTVTPKQTKNQNFKLHQTHNAGAQDQDAVSWIHI